MSFVAGDFTPFPVSDERTESPPPELDEEYPFIGVELIVSGLPRTSFSSAIDHLQSLLSHIQENQHESLPELQIHSPQRPTALNTEPVDYVYVSLAGPLRTVPRPDVLEHVRALIDRQEGPVRARWRVSSGPTDKTRHVWFQASVSSLPDHSPQKLLQSILAICRTEGYRVQRSYTPNNSDRIYFLFEDEDSVRRLIARPPIINNQSIWPHPSRFIQPIFGLEVAINGVGSYPNAQSIIDRYIERKYGDGTGERVVRRSRIEMDGSVYCAVLINPSVTARFLHDDFDVFKDFGAIPTGKPEYLFSLNCAGIPNVGFSPRNAPSAVEAQNPLLQRQVDVLTAEIRAQNAGMMEIARKQQRMQEESERREERQAENNANMFLFSSSTHLLSDASNRVTNIQSNLNNAQQLLLFAPEGRHREFIEHQITDLSAQLDVAQQERIKRLSELVAIQARGALAKPLPTSLSSSSAVENMSSDNVRGPKRARVEGPDSQTQDGQMETEDDIRAEPHSSSNH